MGGKGKEGGEEPPAGDGGPSGGGPPGGSPPGGGPPGGNPPANRPNPPALPKQPTQEEMAMEVFAGIWDLMNGLKDTMTKIDSGTKTKVWDPNVFDGTKPRQLQSFLVSLALVFADRPAHFTPERKVSYALSYLDGAAKEWFEPDIIDPDPLNPPAWQTSFEQLVRELTENFGVYDMAGEAEDRLGSIRMSGDETARDYIVCFNSVAASANWDSTAPVWAFKKGLVSRLKDELTRVEPEPISLAELR